MDLSTFDFRTGKMLVGKMNRSRQRVRYDSASQAKVSRGRGRWAARPSSRAHGLRPAAGARVALTHDARMKARWGGSDRGGSDCWFWLRS